jgi:hypothetical protein
MLTLTGFWMNPDTKQIYWTPKSRYSPLDFELAASTDYMAEVTFILKSSAFFLTLSSLNRVVHFHRFDFPWSVSKVSLFMHMLVLLCHYEMFWLSQGDAYIKKPFLSTMEFKIYSSYSLLSVPAYFILQFVYLSDPVLTNVVPQVALFHFTF